MFTKAAFLLEMMGASRVPGGGSRRELSPLQWQEGRGGQADGPLTRVRKRRACLEPRPVSSGVSAPWPALVELWQGWP